MKEEEFKKKIENMTFDEKVRLFVDLQKFELDKELSERAARVSKEANEAVDKMLLNLFRKLKE